jgi:Mg2+-importing ATPase
MLYGKDVIMACSRIGHLPRSRGNPFKSRPTFCLTLCSLTVAALAVVFPYLPLGRYFGFVPPPLAFYLILAGLVLFYLFAVEGIKQWFFRFAAP